MSHNVEVIYRPVRSTRPFASHPFAVYHFNRNTVELREPDSITDLPIVKGRPAVHENPFRLRLFEYAGFQDVTVHNLSVTPMAEDCSSQFYAGRRKSAVGNFGNPFSVKAEFGLIEGRQFNKDDWVKARSSSIEKFRRLLWTAMAPQPTTADWVDQAGALIPGKQLNQMRADFLDLACDAIRRNGDASLFCFCYPKACHCDIIVNFIQWAATGNGMKITPFQGPLADCRGIGDRLEIPLEGSDADLFNHSEFGEAFIGMASHVENVRSWTVPCGITGANPVERNMSQLERQLFEDCFLGDDGVPRRPELKIREDLPRHLRPGYFMTRLGASAPVALDLSHRFQILGATYKVVDHYCRRLQGQLMSDFWQMASPRSGALRYYAPDAFLEILNLSNAMAEIDPESVPNTGGFNKASERDAFLNLSEIEESPEEDDPDNPDAYSDPDLDDREFVWQSGDLATAYRKINDTAQDSAPALDLEAAEKAVEKLDRRSYPLLKASYKNASVGLEGADRAFFLSVYRATKKSLETQARETVNNDNQKLFQLIEKRISTTDELKKIPPYLAGLAKGKIFSAAAIAVLWDQYHDRK